MMQSTLAPATVDEQLNRISTELGSYITENIDISEETWYQYMKVAKQFIDKSVERLRFDGQGNNTQR